MARLLRAGAWGVILGMAAGTAFSGASETMPETLPGATAPAATEPSETRPSVAAAPAPAQAAPQTAPASVPDEGARRKALALIRNLFKEEYAKTGVAERGALAKRLLREGGATHDDPAARYVALEEAAELASGAGDASTAIASLDEMGRSFRVDVLELKCKTMVRTQASAETPEAGEALANACLALMQQAAAADRFDAGARMAGLAEAAANKTKKVAFVSAMQQPLADFRGLAAEYTQVQQALEKLRADPDGDASNLVVGHFYCLAKGQWDRGLAYLARGSDAALHDLAQQELALPADPLRRKLMADAWWAWAARATESDRDQARRHAAALYRDARSDLAGLTLDEVNRRIRVAEASSGAETQPQDGVNALALVDVAKDAMEGVWKVSDGVLSCDAATHARLQLPVRAGAEYDVRIMFTRTEGSGPVVVLLTGGGAAFGLALDVKGHEARLEAVNHKVSIDNPTRVDCTLENGRQYAVTVRVRKDAVTALLDGKVLTQWKTDYKDLSRYDLWKLNDARALGLGVGKSVVRFEKVEVMGVTGEVRKVR